MNNETIDKVLLGQATGDEARSVACWFEHPQGSLDLVQRIDHDLNQEWDKYYAPPSKHLTWGRVFKYAACVLLIVVASLACGYSVYRHYWQPMPITEQMVYAARGERIHVVLQDGTHIYLNSDSRVTFPSRFSFKERRIHLDGEAYFEVAKNVHHPFVVEMEQASVTVLGTRFNARSYDDEPVQISLDEGSVRFSAPNIADVMLKPGETILYDLRQGRAQLSKKSQSATSAWRNHRIEMHNMPLREVVQLLERQYNVTIHVHKDDCYRHSFTLTMDDQSLGLVLKRMDKLSPLSFRYNEQERMVEIY